MDQSDRIALGDLQHRYGDVVSRRAWDELVELFLPDCRVELALAERDMILEGATEIISTVSGAVSAFDLFFVAVLNSVVGPGPTGRMWMQELRWTGGEHSVAYGLYEDSFARDDQGSWRFAARRYTSISGGRFVR